jgi:hypothetical protein
LELTDVALDQSRARRSVTAARVASADQPLGVRTAPVNIVDNSATAHLLGAYVAVVNDVENAAVDQTIGTYVTAVNVVARIAADPVLDPHLLPVAAIENATDNYSPLRYLGAPVKIADNTAIDHGLSANGATPGWSVQLRGNSSEFGALTSYHRLQATYSALLGPVQPIIIRSAVGAMPTGTAFAWQPRVARMQRNCAAVCGQLAEPAWSNEIESFAWTTLAAV